MHQYMKCIFHETTCELPSKSFLITTMIKPMEETEFYTHLFEITLSGCLCSKKSVY